MYDVAVIGAGVIGGMIARELSRYDLKICILERKNDVAMGATRANSAIVHAGFDAEEGTLKAALNVKGSEMMETVAEELGVKYQRNGSLVIGFNEEDRKEIEKLLARGVANGVRDLRILEKKELHELEPGLAENVECALYAPTGAIICPYELTIAAVGNAMDNGAALLRNFEVNNICKKDGYYEVSSVAPAMVEGGCAAEADDKQNGQGSQAGDQQDGQSSASVQTVEARVIINAAGVYTDKIAGMVGDTSFTVHPRRGEYILLDKECGNMVSHTIFRTPSKMGKGILVSPTVDGNLLTGPTSTDMTDKEDTATTQEGFDKIIREALENVTGIPYGKTITSFCGLRAVGSTGDFIITAPMKGFINVAGIESPGLSASPAIAEYVADMVKEQGIELKQKADFDPRRAPAHHFREADMEEKKRIIKQDKAYGKIVCRCEGISEGEILAALRTNPKAWDLDGVKRRTRSQMGRCQGGFCSPHIVELIAQELNIPIEKVTKSGGNSFVNIGRTKEEV